MESLRTNTNKSESKWFITDAKRLGNIEKTVRVAILAPVFVLGVAGLILGKKGFSDLFLTYTKKAWLIRGCINSLLIIPTLTLFYEGTALSKEKTLG